VRRYAQQEGIEDIDACGRVLERTCEAVALLLDTAETLQQSSRRKKRGKA
jgi:hypothetical protein